MSREQVEAVCDFSHDVIMKLKQLVGVKPRKESLLCHSLAHLNTSNWVERITANGIISRYIVKS
jgi:hypothetical protein